MPPPDAVVLLARLPLTVLPEMVSGPCTQTPPPPTALVLLLTVVSVTVSGAWRKSAPPPLRPLAVFVSNVQAVTVAAAPEDCMRKPPPSAEAMLPTKRQRSRLTSVAPRE